MPDPNAGLPDAANSADFLYSGLFEHFSDALILADEAIRISYLNPAAEQLLGLPLRKIRGHLLDKVFALQDGATRAPIEIAALCDYHAPFDGHFPLLARHGSEVLPVQCTVSRTRGETGTPRGFMIVLRNAHGLQQHFEKLISHSMHDEHTRLLRRAELVKRMWRLLQEPDSGEPQAFMYLDLDNFKAINDQAGHAAGDLAIRQIAGRLKEVVRERDTLARLGGDEFGLLLERCPAELARLRAEQLHRAVQTYVLHWNGASFQLGVSIGLAHFKTHQHSLNTILTAADSACYQAKRDGGDGMRIKEVVLD